jgi:3-dehydrosphinganine reductase
MSRKDLKSKADRFSGKNVVITGGSSGIGFETAVEFGKLGAHLFLIARNGDRLRQAEIGLRNRLGSQIRVKSFPADVALKGQIHTVIGRIAEQNGGLHTLINNAGVQLCGLLENNSVEKLEEVFRINYLGMLYSLKAAWPYLKKTADGHIGFVSSISGFLGLIGYSAYSPTKFAITGIAECVRMEAADHGIGVTVIFPPDTETPMLQYEYKSTLPECKALAKSMRVMTPNEVARKFVEGVLNNRFEVFCNLESRLIRATKAVWPGIYYKIVDHIIAEDRQERNL